MVIYMFFNLKENGMLSKIYLEELSEEFLSDTLVIVTDNGVYDLSQMKPSFADDTYIYTCDNAEFALDYSVVEETSFITRKLSMRFSEKTVLLKIGMKTNAYNEMFMYDTFYNASAAAFARKGNTGLCFGFCNPYCELENGFLYFEPSLILEKNEKFDCDLNFLGLYKLWGEGINPMLQKSQIEIGGRYHPRYRNPGEGIPLYFSEINEFSKYTATYFNIKDKKFKFTSYNFFGNLPQRPETDADKKAYFEHIDAFAAMGGDTIVLNPLYPNKIPNDDENSYWELFPDNTFAKEIYDYAAEKGLKIGIYMGTALNLQHSNCSMLRFCDNSSYKKIDIYKNESKENCLGSDEFVDWFIKVQINTIRKYNLSVWNWDPGPGNGMFCFNEAHGHLGGKGEYKGFRNSLKVMKALKDVFPDLYYFGFHGNKEYGLWGFKYIDQHEAFWENEVYVMNPVFPDLSVDRATADGMRLQSVWNNYFRFMPPILNHGLSSRMVQACWMKETELDRLFDYNGYKFALLSAIAAGGSVTLPILPRNPEKIEGYIEFYKKWIGWAKDNFEYSKHTLPFGNQVGCGVDGYSKIIENEGYIFLFNPFPVSQNFSFALSERIGFSKFEDTLSLDMIYPYNENKGRYRFNENISLTVPEYGALVFKASDRSDIEPCDTFDTLPRTLSFDGTTYNFYGDKRIKYALIDSLKYVNECQLSVWKDYEKRFGRINNCYIRPDRLWLWIVSDSKNIKVTLNGIVIKTKTDFIAHNELRVDNVIFADITDCVLWEKNNKIRIEGAENPFVYLNYPKNDNERIADKGINLSLEKCSAPIVDDNVKIISALVNEDNIIYPNSDNEIKVIVNLPYDELEGVYASVPISIGGTGLNLKRDMALDYKDGIWYKCFNAGPRTNLIIDDCKICFWAVTKENTESKTFKLSINWILK